MKKLYNDSDVRAIADAIRYKLNIENTMTIKEMPDYIFNISRNGYIESDNRYISPEGSEEWVRPQEYENLDNINMDNDFEVVYLSLYKQDTLPWALGLYITATKGCQIEYGHVSNGIFTAAYPAETIKSNTAYSKLLPESETALVAKITNINNQYPITYFALASIPKTLIDTAVDAPYYYNPVVERIGKIPYVTSIANNSTNRGYCCYSLERDALRFGQYAVLTNLSSGWYMGTNLRKLEIEDLDTTHWKVTTLANAFGYCKSLDTLDLSKWDTTTWAVTNLSNMFADSNLKHINLSGWNTTNWKVTTLASIFSNCYLLEDIDLTGWNTTNWAVTTISSAFTGCYNLKQIPMESWNTSHWAVTTLANIFLNCWSLTKLDLSNWDTSNWAVTTLSSTFQNCRNLVNLSVGNWNTSNWKVTSIANVFDNCINITELDLSHWDTSGWAVTGGNPFSAMRKLEKLDLTGWDISNWPIAAGSTTTMNFQNFYALKEIKMPNFDFSNWLKPAALANFFSGCYSLEKVDLSNWKMSNTFTSLASMFANCYNLRKLDLSTWDMAQAPINTITSMFNNCTSLKQLDVSTWDTSNWRLTTIASTFQNCSSLEELNINNWDTSNWVVTTMASIFSGCHSLNSVPIENWNVSNWPLTNIESVFSNCFNLKSIDLSKWNPAKFALTSGRYFCDNCRILEYLNISSIHQDAGTYAIASAIPTHYMLKEIYPAICSIAQNYSTLVNLSRDSILRILNTLPVISGSKTLTLGVLRSKLTVADIAIATEKGWAVA